MFKKEIELEQECEASENEETLPEVQEKTKLRDVFSPIGESFKRGKRFCRERHFGRKILGAAAAVGGIFVVRALCKSDYEAEVYDLTGDEQEAITSTCTEVKPDEVEVINVPFEE